ncbi:hypothetical protein TDMWS_15900 [Thermodesulfomicrobium sp. WS]|uniref:hypothetical protein n=1 Tax=Thermodesulfomicrobium sp. WS TaxID=3004129 RepID=UPI002491D569|nr:hypothetical protein [Thermodesulfomicrobium sp. WS]BDV01505.1 hypothetical protein TDMWS_15900 [Thermodesulfomicrobium sp. WS]
MRYHQILVGIVLVMLVAGCAAMGEWTGKAVRTTNEAVQDFKAGYAKGRGQ